MTSGAAAFELPTLETPRLILRPWREADRAAFVAMNADPEVRRFFPSVMSEAEGSAFLDRLMGWQREGLVFAAAELKSGGLAGMVGLAELDDDLPPAPAVEIGWRLARAHWGQGYATEAARAWLDHAFGPLGLAEVIAFAVPGNAASLAVMRRLGMTPAPSRDFDHPRIAPESPLRRHVLWRKGPP